MIFLQIKIFLLNLQRVFHSIRFKVNKGWSTAVLHFFLHKKKDVPFMPIPILKFSEDFCFFCHFQPENRLAKSPLWRLFVGFLEMLPPNRLYSFQAKIRPSNTVALIVIILAKRWEGMLLFSGWNKEFHCVFIDWLSCFSSFRNAILRARMSSSDLYGNKGWFAIVYSMSSKGGRLKILPRASLSTGVA